MKIKIKVTKDILKRSMMCGTTPLLGGIEDNCAVALAVRDIFPGASIGSYIIFPFSRTDPGYSIATPPEARAFIKSFDVLRNSPDKRLDLPELSFDIEVSDSIIKKIGIGEVYKVLSESRTLELAM